MGRILHVIGTRLVPAILTAAGVALITLGLLSYGDPASAGTTASPDPSATPVVVTARPSAPAPSPVASGSATPTPSADAPSPKPSPSADPALYREITRVAVPALRIDLPVIRQPDPSYPSCDVAMSHDAFGAPGTDRPSYVYAHARKDMFLPLLDASKRDDGRAMLGMLVQVWTSDDRLFLYEITEIRRHVPTGFDLAQLLDDGADLLWLQTSEGPSSAYPKLQVVATLLSEQAADSEAAHPTPKPVDCR